MRSPEDLLPASFGHRSRPASAFSVSLLIAVFSLAVRDSVTSFAVVWVASFVILSGFVIAVWALDERQRRRAKSAEIPDLARGRALYENHCQVCHTPNIHSRPNRLPLNADELRDIVAHWSRQENLRWSPEEVEDVVFYLQQTRYKF